MKLHLGNCDEHPASMVDPTMPCWAIRDEAKRRVGPDELMAYIAELEGGLGVAQARIKVLENAVLFHAEDADTHRNRSIELTEALNKVWDALTAEDKRGALADTLWIPDANCTVFEFIDHTLNPK